MTRQRLLAILAALAAVIATVTTVLTTGDDGTPAPPPAPVVTVPVDGTDAGSQTDKTVTVPKAAVTQAAPTVEDALRDETPADPSTTVRTDAVDKANAPNAPPALPTAGATAGFQGCKTAFVRNQSSRRGVRPIWQVMHYTVSPNRPGWSDVDSIIALFNGAARQASSNFVIDTEGNCAYLVPIEAKAWTQAAANPYSISYEIIATGNEARYLQPAGMRRLVSVSREVSRRTGIPLRRGTTNGCTPGRSGIVQHRDFGTCGGGHGDIAPFPLAPVIAAISTGGVTATDRTTCRKLNWWRENGRPGGKARANAIRRRKAMERRHVACTKSGPVKTA